MLTRSLFLSVALAWAAGGAERTFDFSAMPIGKAPAGFVSWVTGAGSVGDWRIVLDDPPTAFQPLTPNAARTGQRGVLAQVSRDGTDERFPLLAFGGEDYGDFTFTTRFKCVDGGVEQMAGVAFRIQNSTNYYVVRASARGNTFRFYKFVDGLRSPPIGPEIPVPRGVWHELSVECKGNTIRCLLNGREVIPALSDNSFAFGKIGFWTKSDSVSHFADARIVYTPRVLLAQSLVNEALEKQTSIVAVKIWMPRGPGRPLQVVASSDPKEIGQTGTDVEAQVMARDVMFSGRDKERSVALITLPLHDRNGEVVAAVRVELKPFPGQTEQNLILRAMPLIKKMEQRFKEARELVE